MTTECDIKFVKFIKTIKHILIGNENLSIHNEKHIKD